MSEYYQAGESIDNDEKGKLIKKKEPYKTYLKISVVSTGLLEVLSIIADWATCAILWSQSFQNEYKFAGLIICTLATTLWFVGFVLSFTNILVTTPTGNKNYVVGPWARYRFWRRIEEANDLGTFKRLKYKWYSSRSWTTGTVFFSLQHVPMLILLLMILILNMFWEESGGIPGRPSFQILSNWNWIMLVSLFFTLIQMLSAIISLHKYFVTKLDFHLDNSDDAHNWTIFTEQEPYVRMWVYIFPFVHIIAVTILAIWLFSASKLCNNESKEMKASTDYDGYKGDCDAFWPWLWPVFVLLDVVVFYKRKYEIKKSDNMLNEKTKETTDGMKKRISKMVKDDPILFMKLKKDMGSKKMGELLADEDCNSNDIAPLYWSETRVQLWVDSCGSEYAKFAKGIKENGIDGGIMFGTSESDLAELLEDFIEEPGKISHIMEKRNELLEGEKN